MFNESMWKLRWASSDAKRDAAVSGGLRSNVNDLIKTETDQFLIPDIKPSSVNC
jgi:hypothetical protein